MQQKSPRITILQSLQHLDKITAALHRIVNPAMGGKHNDKALFRQMQTAAQFFPILGVKDGQINAIGNTI